MGSKLAVIYSKAYDHEFDDAVMQEVLSDIAQAVYRKRFADIGYRREFVKAAVRALSYLHHEGAPPTLKQLNLA